MRGSGSTTRAACSRTGTRASAAPGHDRALAPWRACEVRGGRQPPDRPALLALWARILDLGPFRVQSGGRGPAPELIPGLPPPDAARASVSGRGRVMRLF